MFRYFFFFLIFFTSYQLNATHLIGGEMNYSYVGEEVYDISLTVYRDCYLGQAEYDVPAYILVYDGDGAFLGYFSVDGEAVEQLPVEIDDECFVAPPNICVQKKIYKLSGTLPANSSGYYLSYQRCCRNNSILNIYDDEVNSVVVSGMNLYTYVPPLEDMENSNPVFNEYPPITICVNKPFYFDHSATDADGDSLVYRLCTPTDALDDLQPIFYTFRNNQDSMPFQEVRWRNPYSLNNMLGGTNPLKIDSKTGVLTALPITIGQFVVGVCVNEYRDGLNISNTRRDFQFNIGECGKYSTAAFFTYDTICNQLDVSFQNQSIESDNFYWDFGDGKTSSLKEPNHTFENFGSYDVTLIASVNSGCADTARKTIHLLEDNFQFDIQDVKVCKGDSAQLTIETNSQGFKNIQWMLSPSVYSNNLSYTYLPNGTQNVDFVISNSNGCKYEGEVNVEVLPLPEINININPSIIYNSQNVEISTDEDENYSYLWQAKGDISTPQSSMANLFVNQDQWVYLTKTDLMTGCQIKDSVFVKIVSCLNDEDYKIEKEIIENCNYVSLAYSVQLINPLLNFIWLVNGEEVTDNVIRFDLPYESTFNAQLVLDNGDDCRDTITIEDKLPKSDISVNISELTTCKENNSIQLYLDIESTVDYQVIWQGKDDTLLNESEILYSSSGQDFVVPFVILFNDSCRIEDSIKVSMDKIAIDAQAQPAIVAKGESTSLSANPETYTSYHWSPSALVDDSAQASTIAIIDETTDFIVIAINEKGCIATDTVRVLVQDLRCGEENIFIPTAFTPNGDGKNDIWKIRTNVADKISVSIYNRWGELVFESNDIEKGWDGMYKGNLSESGSYSYYVNIICQNQEQYFSKGNITIIR